MKILMVCLGNICRSPLAEGILAAQAKARGLNWEIDSAGTNGYHNGEHPHPLSCKVARQHGIDISQQVSRKFRLEDMERFDRIYAMSNDVLLDMQRITGKRFQPEKTDLILNLLFPHENRDVPDPWYGTEPDYHLVYDMLDKACAQIIDQLAPATQPTR